MGTLDTAGLITCFQIAYRTNIHIRATLKERNIIGSSGIHVSRHNPLVERFVVCKVIPRVGSRVLAIEKNPDIAGIPLPAGTLCSCVFLSTLMLLLGRNTQRKQQVNVRWQIKKNLCFTKKTNKQQNNYPLNGERGWGGWHMTLQLQSRK